MKPLTTLKVLDLTNGNPFIGSMFADYGAQVIKVEAPGVGDAMRHRGSVDGRSDGPYYAFYGRNKQSLTIDYTKPAGMDVIKRLLAQVDMVAMNVAEEKMAALGLSYADAKAVNPKIVYGVLTPFGETGPWKDLPDYDLLVMARSGLMEKTGFPEKPTKFGFPIAYMYSSWHLVAGMLASYLHAQDCGEGNKVSVSSWNTMMSLDDTFAQCMQGMNVLPKRLGNGFPTTNPTDTFKCKNGWFALSIGSDDQWLAFAQRAGVPLWYEDERYAHDPARSMENYFGDLDQQLRDYFAQITIEEADQICRDAMVPGGPCNTVKELVEGNEQVETRGMLLHVQDPEQGDTLQFGVPAKFLRDDEHDNEMTPADVLGGHTEAILTGLGLDAGQIEALRAGNVI